MKSFGVKLRELREGAGLTQKQLADKAGVSQQAIDTYERGVREPVWTKVVRLCEALGVDCREFTQDRPATASTKRPRKK